MLGPLGRHGERDTYAAQILRDTSSLLCGPGATAAPSFSPPGPPPRSAGAGHTATVTLTCSFAPLTPIISNIVGTSLQLTASSTFPIRAGILAGIPIAPGIPTPTPTATATVAPTATPTPTGTAGPTPTPGPGPGECIVPIITGQNVDTVTDAWRDAGFNAQKLNVEVGPDNYIITDQWIKNGNVITHGQWGGTFQNCNNFSLNVGP